MGAGALGLSFDVDRRPGPGDVALKLWARAHSRGTGELAGLARDRVLEAVHSRARLIVFVRPTGGSFVPHPDLVFAEATAADARRYARDIGTDSPKTFTARLSATTSCFVVASRDRLVHATWMTTDGAWTRELGGYLCPPRGDTYVYESFTHADARGRGIYPLALDGIAAAAARRGLGRLWVAVEMDNVASLRAVTKAGFTESFVMTYGRSLGRLHVAPSDAGAGGAKDAVLALRSDP